MVFFKCDFGLDNLPFAVVSDKSELLHNRFGYVN